MAEPLLAGRGAELSAVGWLLDAARTGPASLVVEGEAGIGKSALVDAALVAGRERGYRVLFCRGSPSETQFGYVGLADLLAEVPITALRLPAPQLRALQVATRRETADGQLDTAMVATALLSVLRALAADGVVLLAVDDQPWLDASTSAALAFVSRRLAGLPLGLLVARRPDSPTATAWELHRTIERHRTLTVNPLDPASLHEVVRAHLGLVLNRSALLRLHAATGGNPLYALEVARVAGDRLQAGDDEPLPVPGGLVEIVADRLSKVSADVRPVLYAAAAAAYPTVERLRAAFADQADASLEAAEDAGVIRIVADRVEFTHPLLASVVLDQTTAPERRGIHRRLAGVEPEPETRARHLALATLGTSAEVAAALEDAARDAAARGAAPAAGIDLLRMAVTRTPERDEAARLRRRCLLAEALLTSGDLAAAADELDAVLPRLPAGVDRARALSDRSAAAWFQGRTAAAIEFAERALPQVEDDLTLCGLLHLRLAHYRQGDNHRVREHATSAVAALERTGERDALAGALCVLFMAEVVAGEPPRTELIDRALECESPLGSPYHTTVPGSWHLALGQLDAARERFLTLLERDRTRGDAQGEALLLTHLAEVEASADNWPLARRYAQTSAEIAAMQGANGFAYPGRLQAQLDAYTGAHERARAAALAGLDSADAANDSYLANGWLSVLTLVAAAEENPAEVVELTGRAMAHHHALGNRESLSPRDPALERVSALVETGALDEAAALLDQLEERNRRIPRPTFAAAIARGRGLLLAARGDLAGALATTEVVERGCAGWRPFDRARTLLVRGRLLRRARRITAAADALAEAERIFAGIGAVVWAGNARAELGRLGKRRATEEEADLTPTERRVAELIAAGRTNREVAAQLYMSPKTVEAHLTRIYRKLGVRSRAEFGRAFRSQR